MKTMSKFRYERVRILKQHGVALFFALIALLAMSLAAVALIRSVDTSTLIAGNLAFKQSASSSGDAGIETAIAWLAATQAANNGLSPSVVTNPAHPLNNTSAANGYYSNADPALDLFSDATWNAITPGLAITDASGNTILYVIQRMCRYENVPIAISPPDPRSGEKHCLFSPPVESSDGQHTPVAQSICSGPGCPLLGETPLVRITARTAGPKNTVSYIQAFVY
jgi:hypothetical protein